MNIRNFLLLLLAAAVATACSSTRYASTEYDDVYFTSKDEVQVATASSYTEYNDNYLTQGDADYEAARQAYYQPDYDDDDFYFSRRIRRFHQPNTNSWRYYDPYFANDLYYVIGTNSWNTWYNNGWYNWNRPRFGYSFGYGGWGNYATFGFSSGFGGGYPLGFYDPWLASSYNYYNPWVNTYYGYNPFGVGGFNPYFSGVGYGAGFGYGYGGGLYCPPSYYGAGVGGFSTGAFTQSTWRNASRRTSTQSISSQVGSGNTGSSTVKPGTSRRLSAPTQDNSNTGSATAAGVYTGRSTSQPASVTPNYLTPRSRSNAAPSTLGNTRTQTAPRVYTSPSRQQRTSGRSSQSGSQRRSFFNNSNSPNRTYQVPSRSSSPSNSSRTFSAPSRSNSSFNRSSSPSYNRPSSAPTRTPSSSSGSGVRRR